MTHERIIDHTSVHEDDKSNNTQTNSSDMTEGKRQDIYLNE